MKKFTLEGIKRFGAGLKDKLRVGPPFDIRPFPGKYPTRIAVQVHRVNEKDRLVEVWRYIGKPSKEVGKKLAELLVLPHEAQLSVYAVEFDRNGVVSRTDFIGNGDLFMIGPGDIAVLGHLKITHFSVSRYQYYHPSEDINSHLTRYAVKSPQEQIRRIKVGNKIHRVYFPGKVSMKQNIEPHRAWIRENVKGAEG